MKSMLAAVLAVSVLACPTAAQVSPEQYAVDRAQIVNLSNRNDAQAVVEKVKALGMTGAAIGR